MDNELKFSMPFDWNLDRLKKVNLYVHEELSLPKPSPLAANGYQGTINNIYLKPNSLLVDRTNSSKDVVHIMLTKPVVLDLAQKVTDNSNMSSINENNQNMTNEMTFTLSPSKNAVNPGSMIGSNSMNMSMNNGSSGSGM